MSNNPIDKNPDAPTAGLTELDASYKNINIYIEIQPQKTSLLEDTITGFIGCWIGLPIVIITILFLIDKIKTALMSH